MNTLIRGALIASMLATVAMPAMATGKPQTTKQLNQQQIARSNATATARSSSNATSRSNATGGAGGSGGSVGDISVDGGGVGADTGSVIAVAPPAFSYSAGAAVGNCVATTNYAVGFPLIGGGIGEQRLELLPGCIRQLKDDLDFAYSDQRAMAAACQSKFAKGALSSLNVDCDAVPVSAE